MADTVFLILVKASYFPMVTQNLVQASHVYIVHKPWDNIHKSDILRYEVRASFHNQQCRTSCLFWPAIHFAVAVVYMDVSV